jgi:ABC-2 type transport system permease protein
MLRAADKVLAIARMEAQKLRRDPTELFTRAVQPALWLGVFGSALAHARAIPTEVPYLDFLAPGILAQSILFVAIFYGIAAIWERDLGIMQKFLASPTPRTTLVLGKGLSASLRGLSQAVVIYLVALALGVHLRLDPAALLAVGAIAVLGATCFATLSIVMATLTGSRDRFLGIGQVLTLPLFFASNAIYPIAAMPPWLQGFAQANPLSYQVDALRMLMLPGAVDAARLGLDAGVLLAWTVVLVLAGARLYPRLGR